MKQVRFYVRLVPATGSIVEVEIRKWKHDKLPADQETCRTMVVGRSEDAAVRGQAKTAPVT